MKAVIFIVRVIVLVGSVMFNTTSFSAQTVENNNEGSQVAVPETSGTPFAVKDELITNKNVIAIVVARDKPVITVIQQFSRICE